MSFITDKQTTDDLNILGKFKAHSVFSIFNKVSSAGAERLLEKMFREPMTDHIAINRRSALFRYFHDKALCFPFQKSLPEQVENYLGTTANANLLLSVAGVGSKFFLKAVVRDEKFDQLRNAVHAAIEFMKGTQDFLNQLTDYPFPEQLQAAKQLLADPRLSWLQSLKKGQPVPLLKLARYHHQLAGVFQKAVADLLTLVYHFDVYITVAKIAGIKGFTFAEALPENDHVWNAEGLFHPGLEKAVPNSLSFNDRQNLLFLTGANMAGKSTLMKSFGIAVYLAHMGFPVAAKQLRFSVRNGMYSSINVPDNLNLGYSHFYAEVLRVKQVALSVSAGANLVVIFDELFKGTNVKDAFDATLAVTRAFAAYRNCFFIISTHIIEVGEALGRNNSYISFGFMPTVMEGVVPRYTYKLKQGITNDRQGMMIIENEGIISQLTYES